MGILRTLTGIGQTFAGIFRALMGIWRIVLGAFRIMMGMVETAKGIVRACSGAIQTVWAMILMVVGILRFLARAGRTPRPVTAATEPSGLALERDKVEQNAREARSADPAHPERPLPTDEPPSPIFWGAEMCRLPAMR